MWDESSQELATAARIVNAQQDVRAIVWLRSIAQYRCLNFVEIQRAGTVADLSLDSVLPTKSPYPPPKAIVKIR